MSGMLSVDETRQFRLQVLHMHAITYVTVCATWDITRDQEFQKVSIKSSDLLLDFTERWIIDGVEGAAWHADSYNSWAEGQKPGDTTAQQVNHTVSRSVITEERKFWRVFTVLLKQLKQNQ